MERRHINTYIIIIIIMKDALSFIRAYGRVKTRAVYLFFKFVKCKNKSERNALGIDYELPTYSETRLP
jgi:hypothetical protein